jgi:hypothetical protein
MTFLLGSPMNRWLAIRLVKKCIYYKNKILFQNNTDCNDVDTNSRSEVYLSD